MGVGRALGVDRALGVGLDTLRGDRWLTFGASTKHISSGGVRDNCEFSVSRRGWGVDFGFGFWGDEASNWRRSQVFSSMIVLKPSFWGDADPRFPEVSRRGES